MSNRATMIMKMHMQQMTRKEQQQQKHGHVDVVRFFSNSGDDGVKRSK